MPPTMEHLSAILLERGTAILSVLAIVSTVFLLSGFFSKSASLPLVGQEHGNPEKRRKFYLNNAAVLYRKGYESFKNKAYRLTTLDGEHIVVPPSTLNELRKLPDDQIDIKSAIYDTLEAKYTGMKSSNEDFVNHMVRSDLTHSLNRINSRLAMEVERTVDSELGPCDDWTSTIVFFKLLRIVAIVSGHIFLGPDLCRREEYLHASIHFTVDLFTAVRKLKKWNKLLRPIGKYFTPELNAIEEHRKKAKEFLLPVIKERREMMEKGTEEMPDDMLQWMINKAENFNVTDEELAKQQLSLSMAAIHTTTMTTADVLKELAIRPDVVEELRREIIDVLDKNDGVLGTNALFQMKLLDSVLKETQRVNPLSHVRFQRFVQKSTVLKDGTHLPAGSVIEAPHGSLMTDPTLYPDPEKFDPYRFAKLRASDVPDPIGYKNREQYQFVSVTSENMSFGFGRHACPGRFFATNEIKLILARILLHYDIRMPEGLTEKYESIIEGHMMQLNPTNKFEFKRVTGEKV